MNKTLYILRYPKAYKESIHVKQLIKKLTPEPMLYSHDVSIDCVDCVRAQMESCIPTLIVHAHDEFTVRYRYYSLAEEFGYTAIELNMTF